MKFHSLRTALVGSAIAFSAAFLLGSCGGGGAAATGQGGNLILLPQSGTFYAGMPATFTIAGGRRPYRLASSEPGIFPVPNELNDNTLVVIPGNPGVIDNSVTAGQLPIRTVTLQVTDFTNGFQQSTFTVAQNFLTGYGVSYTSNCSVIGSATVPPPACSGGETVARIEPTFNGALIGFKTLRLDIIRGPFKWYNPDGTLSGTDGHTLTVTTDHEGKTNALFKVDTGVDTQVAEYRITDVATGVSTEQIFTINGVTVKDTLTLIPDQFTFTGIDSAHCGTGSGLFLAFDGVPPYTATSTFGDITVDPTTSDANPGKFILNAVNANVCITGGIVVVTDARLARGTLKVDTKVGAGAPPPTPLRVVPNTMTLGCGVTGSATITGGGGAYSVIPPANPNLTANLITPVVQVTRAVDANNPVGSVVSQVIVTDGKATATINVTNPNTCT